jgi:hypothetical protein
VQRARVNIYAPKILLIKLVVQLINPNVCKEQAHQLDPNFRALSRSISAAAAERVSHSARPGAVWGGNAPTACQRERENEEEALCTASDFSTLELHFCRGPPCYPCLQNATLRSLELNSGYKKNIQKHESL